MIKAKGWDIIGDVHGCFSEMMSLTEKLGYEVGPDGGLHHPDGRKVAWVGDLVDRGPKVVECLRVVKATMDSGNGISVMGNHEDMYIEWHMSFGNHGGGGWGGNYLARNGTDVTINAIAKSPEGHRYWFDFMKNLPLYEFLFTEGDHPLIFLSHAGAPFDWLQFFKDGPSTKILQHREVNEIMWNRNDEKWAPSWEGQDASVCVYGHTPNPDPLEHAVGKTFMIDTGCYYGNLLTSLRFPELEYVSVDSVTNPNVFLKGRSVRV